MTNPCLDELSKYQFPNISPDQLLIPPYQVYTEMYIQVSDDYEFFRGYFHPSANQRAQIYRALQFCSDTKLLDSGSESLNPKIQNECKHLDSEKLSSQNYIVFTTPDGLVVKKKPDCCLDPYDKFFEQSDQLVFVPPGYDHISKHKFPYYRRLLSNFFHSERIPGIILVTEEQDHKFLFVALTSPIKEKLSKKWIEYLQGGVVRKYKFPSDYLLAVLNNFTWSTRERFQILTGGDGNEYFENNVESSSTKFLDLSTRSDLSITELVSSKSYFNNYASKNYYKTLMEESSEYESNNQDLICIWVRSPSLDDFEFQLNKICAQSYHPGFNMKDWYYLDLPVEMIKGLIDSDVINNELAVMGIVRILSDNWKVIPLIGTSRIYILNTSDLDCTLDLIQTRLERFKAGLGILGVEGIALKEVEGFEPFTVRSYAEMSDLEKSGLIHTPHNHWYSILDLYRLIRKDSKAVRDPLTGLELSETFSDEINRMVSDLHPIFKRGFPPPIFNPELTTIESESTSPKILFYIQSTSEENSEPVLFWKIPDLRSTDFQKITLDAIQLIVSKWTDKSLFQGRSYYKDPYLIFHPHALYIWEQTLSSDKIWTTDSEILAKKLLKQLHILSQF